jgi:hypothetical protein
MSKLHYWLTVALVVLLFPTCYATRLRFEIPSYLPGFLISWILQSIIWAGLLYQFGVPGAWRELRKNWQRFIVAIAIPLLLVPIFGLRSGTLVCAVGVVILEFYYRRGSWASASAALVPWAYLAFGIQMAFIYNSAIVSVRSFNLYDPFFQRLDALIFGISVAKISHAASRFYAPAEMVYYAMGGVMGAALLFLCLAGDRRAAFRMAGAIVTAYYVSLLVFWAWPSNGPYSLNPTNFPDSMITGSAQSASYFNAAALYHHKNWESPALGYFVAFPSLHVAQPLIAGWFLSRWRRVSLLIFGYCGLLVPAIIVLQWHYLVDIVGGLVIAALAIGLVSSRQPEFQPAVSRSFALDEF